jgi:hypothetical protein
MGPCYSIPRLYTRSESALVPLHIFKLNLRGGILTLTRHAAFQLTRGYQFEAYTASTLTCSNHGILRVYKNESELKRKYIKEKGNRSGNYIR